MVASREMGLSHAFRSSDWQQYSLYSINDVNLNRKKLGKFLGERTKSIKDRPYTLEEIHRMIEVANERAKTIVLILASTGMRIGGRAGLKLHSLQKIEEEYKLYKETIYENIQRDNL